MRLKHPILSITAITNVLGLLTVEAFQKPVIGNSTLTHPKTDFQNEIFYGEEARELKSGGGGGRSGGSRGNSGSYTGGGSSSSNRPRSYTKSDYTKYRSVGYNNHSPVTYYSFPRYYRTAALFATLLWFQRYKLDDNMRREAVCYNETEVMEALNRNSSDTSIVNALDDDSELTVNNTSNYSEQSNSSVTYFTDGNDDETKPELNLDGMPVEDILEELNNYDADEANGMPNEICATTSTTTSAASFSRGGSGLFISVSNVVLGTSTMLRNAWRCVTPF